jgi:hypothetical protein
MGHPLSDRCTATAKGTGLRCRRRVVGGGVCPMHGGRAPQVAARREARIIEGEARLRGELVEPRLPADALLAAAADADAMLQRLKRDLAAGELTPAALMSYGEWLDRTARIAKTVLDAGIDERRVRLVEAQAGLIVGGLRWVLGQVGLAGDERAHGLVSFMLRELDQSRVPIGDPPLELMPPPPPPPVSHDTEPPPPDPKMSAPDVYARAVAALSAALDAASQDAAIDAVTEALADLVDVDELRRVGTCLAVTAVRLMPPSEGREPRLRKWLERYALEVTWQAPPAVAEVVDGGVTT